MKQKVISTMQEFKTLLKSFNYKESTTDILRKQNEYIFEIYNDTQFAFHSANNFVYASLELPVSVNFHNYINDSDNYYAHAICKNITFTLVK